MNPAWWLMAMVAVGAARADKMPVKLVATTRGGDHWTARATYPEFDLKDRLGAMASREVSFFVLDRLRVFRADVLETLAQGPAPTAPYAQQLTPTVSLATTELTSFYLTEWTYTGGAHGNTAFHAFSYGLIAGLPERLELKHLFREGLDARAYVNELLLTKLRENPDALFVADGTVKEFGPEVLERFVITPTSLAWLIQPYEAGPYAAGSFTVKVPFAELREELAARGPMGPVMR